MGLCFPKAAMVSVPAGCWALQGPAEVSGFPGGSVEVPCEYTPELVDANKYWCRGSSWLFCSILVQTTAPGDKAWGDRVSLQDDPTQHLFVVTMENLTVEDGDQYWCGIQLAWYDPMFPVMVSVLPGKCLAWLFCCGGGWRGRGNGDRGGLRGPGRAEDGRNPSPCCLW